MSYNEFGKSLLVPDVVLMKAYQPLLVIWSITKSAKSVIVWSSISETNACHFGGSEGERIDSSLGSDQ
jgi:hypothetical protein